MIAEPAQDLGTIDWRKTLAVAAHGCSAVAVVEDRTANAAGR